MTIATSLAVTFISSIGGSVGKLVTGQVDYWPAIIMIVASLLAAPLGAKAGKNMDTRILQVILALILQVILALMIAGTAVKIWVDILV